jgi:hypothetical protein
MERSGDVGLAKSTSGNALHGDTSASECIPGTSWLRTTHGFFLVLVIIGAGLRLWQFAANTPLWGDEIALARNILERPIRDLLTMPLAYDQMAPKGFLFLEKLVVTALGPNDYALKLVPFVGSLIALLAFWRVALRVLDACAASVALGLFAAAVPLVSFASQVKQYSTDVTAAVLMLWLALHIESESMSPRWAMLGGVAGAVVVWFSQPVVLVLIALSAWLALLAWQTRTEISNRQLLVLSFLLAMWIAAALAAIVVSRTSMTASTYEYMEQFWKWGFLPLPPARALKMLWPWDQLKALFGTGANGLAYPIPSLYLALTAVGFWLLWRQRPRVAALIIAPVGVALGAAVAQQYPFSDRLILFLLPSFFLAIAAAVDGIRRQISRFSATAASLGVLLLVTPPLYSVATLPPPYWTEDVRPALSHLQAGWRQGDAMYVYYGAGAAMTFYGTEYGFSATEYVIGGCHRGDNRRYLQELDTFRGHPRLWVVMTHAVPRLGERADILNYLDTIGRRSDTLVVHSRRPGAQGLPVEVFRYDLSDTRRLTNTNAMSFPLIGPSKLYAYDRCRGWVFGSNRTQNRVKIGVGP